MPHSSSNNIVSVQVASIRKTTVLDVMRRLLQVSGFDMVKGFFVLVKGHLMTYIPRGLSRG